MYQIGVSNRSPVLPDVAQVGSDCIEFLKQCFIRDAKIRPTAKELLDHPWLNSVDENEVDIPGVITAASNSEETSCSTLGAGPSPLSPPVAVELTLLETSVASTPAEDLPTFLARHDLNEPIENGSTRKPE